MFALSDLDADQRKAVEKTEGYVRVIASAGSGKTRALTYRYAYLVRDVGVSTQNIACITFTNKAAQEMKKRIRSMLGDFDLGYICTFHGLGLRILREDIGFFGWPNKFRILDEDDQEAILRRVYKRLGITSSTMTFKDAKDSIRNVKITHSYIKWLENNRMVDIDCFQPDDSSISSVCQKILYWYVYEQKKEFALDFDDMIILPLDMFARDDVRRRKWADRMQYVMVDEFQDVSPNNYLLCEILSSVHKNLFIVGDPDQVIYSWRGANVGFILKCPDTHPNTSTIFMNTNYRCASGIVDSANSLINFNNMREPKQMISKRLSSLHVNYIHKKTQDAEATYVADTIKLIVDSTDYTYRDITILYRAHYVSRVFEQALIKAKIPYQIVSGIPFYSRKEVKDVLSYMRFILDENDIDFYRVIKTPKRGIGDKKISILEQYAQEFSISLYDALKDLAGTKDFAKTDAKKFLEAIKSCQNMQQNSCSKVSDIVNSLCVLSGIEEELRTLGDDERLENLASLKESIVEYENLSAEEFDMRTYLDDIALYTSADFSSVKNQVSLMTIHSAKGLEWPYVFVVGMNEGIFPSARIRRVDELEEERRLAYVAYTRCKEELFLTESEGLNLDQSYKYPSRFIFNTGKKNLRIETPLEDDLFEKANDWIKRAEESMKNSTSQQQNAVPIKQGDKVYHLLFKEGIVLSVTEDSCVVKFESCETERTIVKNKLKRISD